MSRKMKLDFTGVESYERAAEGRHVVKIATADLKQSQGGNDMIVVAFEVTKGDSKGARVYENYPLVETALWKLKGMLQAIGMKADGKVQLDLDKLVGKVCEIEVKHEEYDGKIRARVDSVYKLRAASSDDDEIEEENEDEDDGFDEDEEDEEEEKPVKKSSKKEEPKKADKKPAKKAEPEEDDDEDEDWDDDDDEEEEEPAPKKKVAKKPEKAAAKKPAKKSEPEDDDDDDDDWDEDEE